LSGQQAKPAEFFVGENHLFTSVAVFQMAQSTDARKASEFGRGQPEQDSRPMLLDPILKIPVYESHRISGVRGANENPNRHSDKC
jgi:hypothetical protein